MARDAGQLVSDVDALRNLLSLPEFREGTPRVVHLNAEIERALGVRVAEEVMSFFLLRLDGLWSDAVELIAIERSATTDQAKASFLVTLLPRILQLDALTSCQVLVHVREEGTGTNLEGVGCPVEAVTPAEFYRRLLPIPSHFKSLLQDVAQIDRGNDFRRVYQRRSAILYSGPRGDQSRHTVVLDEHLKSWLSARFRPEPVLLLGDRGTGKSWQLLHFALSAHDLHHSDPWQYGPVFFVRVRELVRSAADASGARTVLADYLLEKYFASESMPRSPAFLSALLASGNAVLCVDGFDEIDVLPTDESVQTQLATILLLLSRKTRFIVTSRTGHFPSLRSLLKLRGGRGATVANTFEVLGILPFDDERKKTFVKRATGPGGRHLLFNLLGLVRREARNRPQDAMTRAMSACGSHPGILAHIADAIERGERHPVGIIGDAIVSVLLEHNLREGRTSSDYSPSDAPPIDLSVDRRVDLLGELAWHMAVLGVDAIDISELPSRLRELYGVGHQAVQRDLRSQTVLEPEWLDDPESLHQRETRGGEDQHPSGSAETRSRVRFALPCSPAPGDGPGDTSVAAAYFLALYIRNRVEALRGDRGVPVATQLAPLGTVPIGPIAAAILAEMLHAPTGAGNGLRSLGRAAWRHLRECARRRDLRIYQPPYRYLAQNLALLGALESEEADVLTPWSREILSVLAATEPGCGTEYPMALVPPPTAEGTPFLLGLHEVTHGHYAAFIEGEDLSGSPQVDDTVRGSEWRVARMTFAGSTEAAAGRQRSLSRNHVLSNEYHLFFWLPRGEQSEHSARNRFLPPERLAGHPVTYVSWYAAAAFCDWLSISSGRQRYYWQELLAGVGPDLKTPGVGGDAYGFRLPTQEEWTWAARCGHADAKWAWELYPFYRSADTKGTSEENERWYDTEQAAMQRILMESGKESKPVMHDEPNEFGLFGMFGNVREWCHDHPLTGDGRDLTDYRLILGSTGYLGRNTFRFDYATWLYPQNTNPDVGFRVARTVDPEDEDVLRARERHIANLPDTPLLDTDGRRA